MKRLIAFTLSIALIFGLSAFGASAADEKPFYLVLGDDMNNYADDEIHPSAKGNEIIAELIINKLYEIELGTGTTPVISAQGKDINISSAFTAPLKIMGVIFNALSVIYTFVLSM